MMKMMRVTKAMTMMMVMLFRRRNSNRNTNRWRPSTRLRPSASSHGLTTRGQRAASLPPWGQRSVDAKLKILVHSNACHRLWNFCWVLWYPSVYRGASCPVCASIPAQHTLTLGSFWHWDILFGYCLVCVHFRCVLALTDFFARVMFRLVFLLYWVREVHSGLQLSRKTISGLRCFKAMLSVMVSTSAFPACTYYHC